MSKLLKVKHKKVIKEKDVGFQLARIKVEKDFYIVEMSREEYEDYIVWNKKN